MATATVHLVGSAAPLLSAKRLSDCQTAEDPTCQGGVAAVAAHIRHQNNTSPVLVCPRLDLAHEFVQSHPSGWNVNTRVLQEHFGWKVFTANPELLTESKRDVSGLQTPKMPLLMTNVAIPPSNAWHPYVESVHFDASTNLALVSLEDKDANPQLGWSPVESALASLDYIAAQNQRNQCGNNENNPACWIPVILVYSSSTATAGESFEGLVRATARHNHPAALIIDWEGKQTSYATPKVTEQDVWIVSQALTQDKLLKYTLTVDLVTQRINDFKVVESNLLELPSDLKRQDETYANDIAFLRQLADEAIANDPILINSNAMSRADTGRCQKQECELGNLIADSLQWKTEADVAFLLGNTLTGPGWSFGQVHVSNIFQTIPTPTTICTGKLSGKALAKVLDHALRINNATAVSDNKNDNNHVHNNNSLAPLEDRFLQVSGLQVVYNDQLQNSTSLVSVKVWDKKERAFLEVNPFRLYQFATTEDVCEPTTSSSYGSLLQTDDLRLEDGTHVRSGSSLLQNAVGDYLLNFESTYVPALEDRVTKDVIDTTALDIFSSSSGACQKGAFWEPNQQSCAACPSSRSHVTLSDNRVDFKYQTNTNEPQIGRVVVVNRDLYDFVLVSKDIPDWFEFTGATTSASSALDTLWPQAPVKLPSGEKIAFDYAINTTKLGVGVTFSTVYFNVSDYEPIPDCFSERYALPFDALIQVTPLDLVVDLGYHAIVGFVLMSVVLLGSFGLGLWVYLNRERWGYGNLGDRSSKSIQPLYMGTICFGVFIMALTIGAISADEGIISKLCLVGPWLLSLGLTIVFSALLSKLSTAQKIAEQPQERTVQVSYKDLFMPFGVLFVINFAILFTMLIDPPTWEQQALSEDWKFYGFCDYGALSSSLLIASGLVHFSTLCYTCYRTYRLSNMSDEFVEIKDIGLAVFFWLQIVVVAIPVWFVIDHDNIVGRYYFKVAIISAMSLSMLLSIFVPALTAKTDTQIKQPVRSEVEKSDDNGSYFGGFLGFSNLAGSASGSHRYPPQAMDDEEIQQEEQNRCLADRLCY